MISKPGSVVRNGVSHKKDTQGGMQDGTIK